MVWADQPGHAEGAHHVTVGGNDHLDVEQALESGYQGLVSGGRALEHDAFAAVVTVCRPPC